MVALAASLAPFNIRASTVAPPFSQCPHVGLSPSCGSLLVINPDRSVSVYTDPAVSPFDGIEDTLIGVQNDSGVAVGAITAYGPPGIFGFDGDGLCAGYSPSPSGCPFGSTTYEGPGVSFVFDPNNTADGEIDFAGAGIPAGGSAFLSLEGAVTSATLKAVVGRLSFCNQAGVVPSPAGVASDGWSFNYGISVCEGLVVSNVALGKRLMAERMSVPYLDLLTCTSNNPGKEFQDIRDCSNPITRHITLRTDEVEAQSDPTAYTRVHLLGSGVTRVAPPSTSPCLGRSACGYVAVHADYRVDLTPATGSGPPDTYLDITQRYEFYRPFSESQFKDIACEPSQSAPVIGGTPAITPLPDCGRWKPLVSYQFTDTPRATLLVSLNAAARLHFTPDGLAVRASTFFRDCDATGPPTNCDQGLLEIFAPGHEETAMTRESVIRGLVAVPTDAATRAGRYDNVHQTPSSFVQPPLPLPPGCFECVHIHWRWTANALANAPAFFGFGQPLIGDGEPAAVPNGLSHQQLDAAMVAFHPGELAPANFMQLVQNPTGQLAITRSSDYNTSGFVRGSETPEHPSGSCANRADLASWGQCGQVLWLSATAYTNVAHDEEKDVFFAFGGFFCEECSLGTEYQESLIGLQPTYMEDQHIDTSRVYAPGSKMTIHFSLLRPNIQLNDVLPPGVTGVTAFRQLVDSHDHPLAGSDPIACPVAFDAGGRQVVTCQTPPISPGLFTDVTITGTVGGVGPLITTNTVRAIWGDPQVNLEHGGNYKHSDDVTITL